MKKTYISPSAENINVYTDGIMKNGASFLNYGDDKEKSGYEDIEYPKENTDKDIEIDAKHNTWGSLWD